MYVIVDIKGFQYKLEKGERLHVPKCDVEVGKKITFPEVLLVADGDKVSVGTPFVDGAVVEATVAAHDKDKKIIVFKKKRRKDYSVKRGHRQEFTEIVIENIKFSKVSKVKTAEAAETAGKKKIDEAGSEAKAPKVKKEVKTAEVKKKKAAKPKAAKSAKAKAEKKDDTKKDA